MKLPIFNAIISHRSSGESVSGRCLLYAVTIALKKPFRLGLATAFQERGILDTKLVSAASFHADTFSITRSFSLYHLMIYFARLHILNLQGSLHFCNCLLRIPLNAISNYAGRWLCCLMVLMGNGRCLLPPAQLETKLPLLNSLSSETILKCTLKYSVKILQKNVR
jgi:hypothetical protein